jgi:D-alanyl-D-alanine carboxypeptidase
MAVALYFARLTSTPTASAAASVAVTEQASAATAGAAEPSAANHGPVKLDLNRLGVVTEAAASAVIDWDSGVTLFDKQADSPQPIASITKLMTALVAAQSKPDWQRVIEVKESDRRSGAAAHLYPGDHVTLEQAFNVMLVASANEAAVVVARSIGLSTGEFVEKMNATAARLGMTNTFFEEPTGLDDRNRASARDVATLVRAALAYDEVSAAVTHLSYSFVTQEGKARAARSTDDLLDSFLARPPYRFLGGKTGYLSEAGYCFAAAAENEEGHRVIAVALGSPDKDQRFQDVKAMIYWSFDAYRWKR